MLLLQILTLLVGIVFANAQCGGSSAECGIFEKCTHTDVTLHTGSMRVCVPDFGTMAVVIIVLGAFCYICSFGLCLFGIKRISRSFSGKA